MSLAAKSLFGFFVSTLIAFSASAQNYDLTGRWGVGGGLGITTAVSPQDYKDLLDGGASGSLWVRYHLDSRFALELAYSRLSFDYKSGPFDSLDPAADVLDFSVAYRAWPKERLHMLVQLGVGYARTKQLGSTVSPLRSVNHDDLALKARLGAEYMATENFALALQADYFYVNLEKGLKGLNTGLRTLVPMVALTYYFGGASTAEAAPAMIPVTAATTSKLDADKDGIADADDKCPGTQAGQQVNEFGCAPTEKMEFTLNVQFANGSSKIDDAYLADVQKLADFMTKNPTVKAEIEGHTDNTGSEKINFSISQKRAAAVRTYLITKAKIDKSRLTAKGYGPSQPVADNSTPEGRLKNRRVIAHVKAN